VSTNKIQPSPAIPLDIVVLWQFCLEFEYDRSVLVTGISEWLEQKRVGKILDCACGTGFPSLDLIQRGFQVTCTDGSPAMLTAFESNAERMHVNARARLIKWNNLPLHFSKEFDALFCRGSSLIYADSWDKIGVPGKDSILEAVTSFHSCLRQGGYLYVDTTSAESLRSTQCEEHVYPKRLIKGADVQLTERVETDVLRKVRKWTTKLVVDGATHELCRQSYYLPHEELLEMLRDVGFEQIRSEAISGEHYAVFTARAGCRGRSRLRD
jgi:SAM-dependent methyltransferase